MALSLFGFSLSQANNNISTPDQELTQKTFALPSNEDGSVTIASGSYFATYVDLEGVVRNEVELITRYREMAMQPELESAIDNICNEAIVTDDKSNSVDINTEDLKVPESIKKKIHQEFNYILKLLNFKHMGYEIFRRWYIDGRLNYHVVINEKAPRLGIQELRYIDPRRIRKIREVAKTKDPATGIEIIKSEREYYLYNERGIIGTYSNLGAKIAPDSIISITSGLMDPKRAMVLSYLHKAIKPLNNLRMMEDATVIYRMSRAPERRIFYVDVGNMSTIKAEQYLKDVMSKYRNKVVYDASTGEIKDSRNHLSMLEDFWLARREGTKGTEITTLQGGQNLGELEDVKYFQKKLFQSLNIPITRLEPQQGFSLGRSTEITRDEVIFNNFITRLRSKFSTLFDNLLRTQLLLKNILTEAEWNEFKEHIYYDFNKDNNFNELKDAELIMNRVQILTMLDPFVGKYYSINWVRRNILHQKEEEIEDMDREMEEEAEMQAAAAEASGIDPVTGEPLIDQNTDVSIQKQEPEQSNSINDEADQDKQQQQQPQNKNVNLKEATEAIRVAKVLKYA